MPLRLDDERCKAPRIRPRCEARPASHVQRRNENGWTGLALRILPAPSRPSHPATSRHQHCESRRVQPAQSAAVLPHLQGPVTGFRLSTQQDLEHGWDGCNQCPEAGESRGNEGSATSRQDDERWTGIYSDLDLRNECCRFICATNANLSPKAHGGRAHARSTTTVNRVLQWQRVDRLGALRPMVGAFR